MSYSEQEPKNIWEESINSLDELDLLPPPPPEPVPLSELFPTEQARAVWNMDDENEFGYKDYLLEQPDFGPHHIKSFKELRPGMIVLNVGHNWSARVILLSEAEPTRLSEKSELFLGFRWIYENDWQKHASEGKIYVFPQFCEDCGLISNDEHGWHPNNHLCYTDEYLPEADLQRLLRLEHKNG